MSRCSMNGRDFANLSLVILQIVSHVAEIRTFDIPLNLDHESHRAPFSW